MYVSMCRCVDVCRYLCIYICMCECIHVLTDDNKVESDNIASSDIWFCAIIKYNITLRNNTGINNICQYNKSQQ